MKTQRGADMSPRMERLWRFIREQEKIPLNDWSTDEGVARVLPQLQAARAKLVKILSIDEATGVNGCSCHEEQRDNEQLLRDLDSIISRIPAARRDS